MEKRERGEGRETLMHFFDAVPSRRAVICILRPGPVIRATQIIALYGGALDNDRRVSVETACELGRVYHCQSITLSGLLSVALKTTPAVGSRVSRRCIATPNAKHRLAFTRTRRDDSPSCETPSIISLIRERASGISGWDFQLNNRRR